MAETLYQDGAGVEITTYAGPELPEEPRTRVQIGVVDTDRGGWKHVSLTLTQWAALCDGIRAVAGKGRL